MQKGLVMNIPRRFVQSDWGGTETVIQETSKQLTKMGFETEIVTTMALSKVAEDRIENIKVKRFSYSYTRWGLSKKNKQLLDMRGGNMYSLGLLVYLLFTKDIKIIHLHTLGRLGNLARLVAKFKRIPYLVSIHGGLYDLPKKQLIDLVAPTKNSFNWGKLIDLLLPSDKLMSEASAIVCVGEAEKDKLSDHYPDKRVEFLPNGVDIDYIRSGNASCFFEEAKLSGFNWSKDDKIISCVSSFYPQKNQLTLLKAFLKSKQTNPNLKLLLVGVIYDKDYFKTLLDYIHKNHLEDSVWIRTDVRYGEKALADCYVATDTFVLTSRYETFGIVVLEAWAAGAKVICSNVGGLDSLVTHNYDVVVTNVDCEESISQEINSLQTNKQRGLSLVKNATLTVENYSWRAISEKLANLYQEVECEAKKV